MTPDNDPWAAMDRVCTCGSNLPRRQLLDARGIFCTFVCDWCEDRRRRQFRPEIFTDSNYPTDEPVEPE